MKVVYTGGGSLAYRSAPSGFPYVFFSGVPQSVKPEDEQFFRNKAANPANPWKIESVVEKVVKVASEAVEKLVRTEEDMGKEKGKDRGKTRKHKGVEE